MLVSSDLVSLPFTPDLVESGIACACRSLARRGVSGSESTLSRLRAIVLDVAVELAFRRHLTAREVPFGVFETVPFTDPDHYDISLGGHRCILVSDLVSQRRMISLLRREPDLLLKGPALVPLEQFTSRGGRPDDIHLFAFMLGLQTASRSDLDRALAAGQPLSLVHPMPVKWKHPSPWLPLDDLVLKNESDQPINLQICGQDAQRQFITTAVELLPRQRTPLMGGFHSVLCLRVRQPPRARIGIHSPVHGDPYLVASFDWTNLWIHGMQILLAGWLTRENYRSKATVLNPGKRTSLGGRIDQKCLQVLVGELNPLAPLFHRVREWAAAGPGAGK